MFKQLGRTTTFFFINLVIVLLSIIINISSYKFLLWGLMLGSIVYLCLLTIEDLVSNQIILLINFNIIYDILWRKTSMAIPMEFKYLVDIISIIIIFKLIFKWKQFKCICKDSVFWVSVFFMIFSCLIALINRVTIIEFLMSLRIYIRFLPTYIVLSIANMKYGKYHLYMFLAINLFLVGVQAIISYYDDVAGVFGLRNVHILLLLLICMVSVLTVMYCKKKINIIFFILGIVVVFLICGLGEIKIGMAIIPIEIIVIILLNTINPIKLLISIIVCVVMINVGLDILIKVSPEFVSFFEISSIKQNIINYTMKSNNPEYTLGRLENIVYSNNNILTLDYEKAIGLGIGSAMPSETYYYELPKHNRGREIKSIYETKLYRKYGVSFGYHLSSANIVYLESGFFGFFIYALIMIIFIKRSIYIIVKSTLISDKCIGNAGIAVIISFTALAFYYNYIIDRGAISLIIFILALIRNRERAIKIERI